MSAEERFDTIVVGGGQAGLTMGTLEADHVVVATGAFNDSWTPGFAGELREVTQMHSKDYRNSSQLSPGPVLLVGAGNSGADSCMETVRTHRTYLAGRHPGHIPFRIDGLLTRNLVHVVRFLGHHVLNWDTPVGRKVLPKMHGGNPLVRVKPKDIVAAGVELVPRVAGVKDGLPLLEDGRVLEVANVIWCTGFRSGRGASVIPLDGCELTFEILADHVPMGRNPRSSPSTALAPFPPRLQG